MNTGRLNLEQAESVLFDRAKHELKMWLSMVDSGNGAMEQEVIVQRERFYAVFQVIVETGLDADFYLWLGL